MPHPRSAWLSLAYARQMTRPPITAAQLIALSRDIDSTVVVILDPMIDMVIEKVNVLTESNVK